MHVSIRIPFVKLQGLESPPHDVQLEVHLRQKMITRALCQQFNGMVAGVSEVVVLLYV